ncbi:MAG TPA: NUDIX hydrolase [Stellaceae bacterium]|jgi:8-oxo-dGTP pyrophosphatase MutT (NUDIX family)
MAKVIKPAKSRRLRDRTAVPKTKQAKGGKGRKWRGFATDIVSTPLAAEMVRSRQVAPPRPPGQEPLLESGVLAFRYEGNAEPMVLLISKKRSKKWGIPKGRIPAHLSFSESAAKEAFEEAGVVGRVSPSAIGMYRAEKSGANPLVKQIIEVWVYLLEVTEALPDWPEKGKRATRWVSCEAAARQLREPVLTHLCHRLAQG